MEYIVHGILQARILEWVAFSFSRRSSQPRDWTQVSHIAGRFFTWEDSLPDSLPGSLAEPQGKPKNIGVGSLVNLPNPGIEPGSPALPVDSLLTELSGKASPGPTPTKTHTWLHFRIQKESVIYTNSWGDVKYASGFLWQEDRKRNQEAGRGSEVKKASRKIFSVGGANSLS